MHVDSILTGQVLTFADDPFRNAIADAAVISEAVLLRDGCIVAIGDAATLKAEAPTARVISYGSDLIMAGFVDAHVHYPQTAIVASWGKRLIDWLNTYTFPEEMRFGDPDYAAEIAGRYIDFALHNGTTSMASYCTIHP